MYNLVAVFTILKIVDPAMKAEVIDVDQLSEELPDFVPVKSPIVYTLVWVNLVGSEFIFSFNGFVACTSSYRVM